MSDRFSLPIRPRVRLITVASALSISLLAGGIARAQDKTAATQPPAAGQDQAVPAPAGAESQISGSRGNLVVTVQAYDETTGLLAPAPNVVVRVESDFERPRYGLTDAEGKARLRLFTGRYKVVVTSAQYQRDEKFIEVHEARANSDQFDATSFILYTRVEVERVRLLYSLLDRTEISNITKRDQKFFQDFPMGIGNRQSLPKQLRSIPGFVEDSLNQIHPRGENSVSMATVLDGVELPPVASGHIAQFLLPDSISSFKARVGGLAPEFGGGSGAILDLQTRPASPAGRYMNFYLDDGDSNTSDVAINFGNSSGGGSGGSIFGKKLFSKFRYDVSLSERATNEATEAPQDATNNPVNYGVSDVGFVKGTFDLSPGRSFSALANFSSGKNGVANRLGFLPGFKNFGAGFGFLGEKNFDGTQGQELPTPQTVGVPSQDDFGQNFRQKDNNNLVMLQGRNKDAKGNEQMIAVGVMSSTMFIGDHGTSTIFKQNALPNDNSIEYLPTVLNDYQHFFFQADYTSAEPKPEAVKTHRLKIGALFHSLDGLDSYQFIPQSILALDELYAVDPRLAPSIKNSAQMVATGRVDSRGNLEFKPTSNVVDNPVLYANRTGTYAAAYIQDTYKITQLFRLNYGIRLDNFNQKTEFSTSNPDYAGMENVDRTGNKSVVSPRVNALYVFRRGPRLGGLLRPLDVLLKPLGNILNEQAILRVSFNRLVAPPESGQGYFTANQRGTQADASLDPSTFTAAPVPQIVDQWDLSLERQIGDFTVAKFGIYSKDIKNTLTMRSVLTPLQAGMLSTLNQGDGVDDGVEFGVETNPRMKDGSMWHGFLSFANSSTQPKDRTQFTNLAGGTATRNPSDLEEVRSPFYEFDQTNTLSGGISYTNRKGGSMGMTFMFGSGLYSSKLALLPNIIPAIPNLPTNRDNPVRTESREKINEVNLQFATRPNFLYPRKDGGGLGLQFGVENLFNSVSRMNWRGPFAGTRYQLGRRIFVAVTGKL